MGKPTKDITKVRFGHLVAEKYVGNSKWECLCDCGNTTTVRTCNLTNGHTQSCGCIKKEQSVKNGRKALLDLSEKRFGMLVAKKYDAQAKKWVCVCDCGNICLVSQNNLCRKISGTKSCGCKVSLDKANETNIIEGTNLGQIKSNTVFKNSKTGIRGVFYSESTGMYVATIGWQSKQYILRKSKNVDECTAARKEAENRIFSDFLEWYEKKISKENSYD